MSWYAKPSGGYAAASTEGKSNIFEIYNYLSSVGYTKECVAGICGNIANESAYNPWRWQGDTVSNGGGYGLMQFTPAVSGYYGSPPSYVRGYIQEGNIYPTYAPNMSVTTVSGGVPSDGKAQLQCFADDKLSKWSPLCWREGEIYAPYWIKSGELWDTRRRILNTYVGQGANSISMEQFKRITNVHDAAFVFMACYEGPQVPNINPRYASADTAYEILGGVPPTPPTPTTKKLKLIYYLKRRY